MAEESAALKRIKRKYGDGKGPRQDFDRTAQITAASTRVSDTPTLAREYNLEEHARMMTRLNGDLVDLANAYEKLNADFQNTSMLGRDKFYTFSEALFYNLYRVAGRTGKMRTLQVEAAGRKAKQLTYLTDKIAEIFDDNYQGAMDGRQHMQEILAMNLAHRRALEEKIVGNLRESYQSDPKKFELEEELKKMEAELSELDGELQRYERLVEAAKAKEGHSKVEELTAEMLQILDIKYGILEGRTAAQNSDREMRMKILDYAEGIQSARNALEMAYANAEQITNMIDVFWKIEIKYRHSRSDIIPIFQEQARIASEAEASKQMVETYQKAAAISSELMKANAILVGNMVNGVMKLLTMTFYDPEVSKAAREQLNRIVEEARKEEERWSSEVLKAVPQGSSGYAAQR